MSSVRLQAVCMAAVLALSMDGLTEAEQQVRASVMQSLVPFLDQRKREGSAPLISFEELYARLNAQQQVFLDAFRAVDPAVLNGSSRRLPPPSPTQSFVRIEGQAIHRAQRLEHLDIQFLPVETFEAYRRMMAAMEIDLGKRLLVESGYRSPAYQLYLFLFYLPKHRFSIRETNRHVALPGCSEHGSPAFQAIDFITPEGINGEDRPEEFEELQEYGWLQTRAQEFGFYLSYPRPSTSSPARQEFSPGRAGQAASAFEPWHWHWEEPKETAS